MFAGFESVSFADTVAVYSWEDRLSMHRQKADEAYIIGKLGQFTPVGAYLASDEIVRIAKEHNVDMIHPGYGFLSENEQFARNVEKAGLIVSFWLYFIFKADSKKEILNVIL